MTKFNVEAALKSNAWPFQEAQALVKRLESRVSNLESGKDYVLFETGYGPSGLPHIGTFGEVARTTMVRHAFEKMSGMKTKLFAFSDDMDGLRKVPDNLPNQEMIAANIGKPLTSIPDPFGTHESFGQHMNAELCKFLDHFGFDYEFKSSTATYKSGEFDQTLLKLLQNYDKVMKVMLPTLGEERQQTYSPFLPVSPRSGKVLLAKVVETRVDKGTIVYQEEDGTLEEVLVTGGHCKLQWKPDMGMRWAALGVDYEMYGKDHLTSATLYDAICRIAGGTPPEQFMFELFLDEKGEKISKSKGNGISMEEWLRYGTPESLSLFMYQSPRKAKRLHFDVIPKNVDEYYQHLEKFPEQTEEQKFANPTWHIHNGNPPKADIPLTFGLLLNLASVCNPDDKSVLWGFISTYAENASPKTMPDLDRLVERAIRYYDDFVKPNKKYRSPTDKEKAAMQELAKRLAELGTQNPESSAEEIQNLVFAVGNEHGFTNLREWFGALYEVLLGQAQGPRMGSFIKLYGVEKTIDLLDRALKGELLAA